MAQIDLAVPRRRTRRRESARVGQPDLRRDAAPLVPHRRRAARPRLAPPAHPAAAADPPARCLGLDGLLLARARHVRARGAQADRRWEAFCFGTRLTRVTRALEGSDPDEALTRAAAQVVDWDGGTRIGDSLKRFLDEYGHGGLARGAVVVICSDGLEVGDPEVLAAQMARLSRLAHSVIWLNPLQESPAYEPLARGMHAALPLHRRVRERPQRREPRGARRAVREALAQPVAISRDERIDRSRDPAKRRDEEHASAEPAPAARGA